MSTTLHYRVCVDEHGEVTKMILPAKEFSFGTQNRFLLDEAFVFTEKSETCVYATEESLKTRTEQLVMHVVKLNLSNITRMEAANKKLLACI